VNKNKKVTIIGGCGFIGHNLGVHLKEKYNCDVTLIDSFQVNNFLSILSDADVLGTPKLSKFIIEDRINFIQKNKIKIKTIDARDYHALTNVIKEDIPDYIVHLAAVSHSNRSNKDPHSTFDHSFRTLENALDISKGKVKKFIYLSSSMVYGNFKKEKVDENEICEPIGIYGALKLSGEMIVKAYNQVFGLPYIIIRPSALYGERCISRRVSQVFVENALSDKEIIIDGNGEEKLDFTYIKDLIEGISLSIFNDKVSNETFNLTYGHSRTINTLLEITKKNFENIKIRYQPRDKLMPKRGTLSIDKAKKLLGYSPTWNLEKGFNNYISWYKKLYSHYRNNEDS
jgi:nucleoside-diphosphate-sugar epimerase